MWARRVGVVVMQPTCLRKKILRVSTAMPGIAQAAAARAGVARGRGRRRKALTAEEQAERDDYLREASFTAGTFTWSLFFFSAFLLGLASLITQHLVLGSLYGKRCAPRAPPRGGGRGGRGSSRYEDITPHCCASSLRSPGGTACARGCGGSTC